MATKRQAELTAAQWTERAVALADARHLTGTARLELDDERGRRFLVPSANRSGTYVVMVAPRWHTPQCTCVAASYGNPCCHAGAVLFYLQARAAAQAAATRETFDSFRHNCGGY